MNSPKRSSTPEVPSYVAVVSCSDCRFSSSSSTTTPNRRHVIPPPSPRELLRSLYSTFTCRSTPRSSPSSSATTTTTTNESGTNDGWRVAASDLSRKLLAATRTRDEALLETARLKYSLAELELKLARLETHLLPSRTNSAFPLDSFLRSVSAARSAVRLLARSLSTRLRNPNPSVQMESFLNKVFFANFETDTDEETRFADPADRCEANRGAYESVSRLTWEEVLAKGTKHYSEGLSKYCDAKMSDVVGSLGWARARAWPEPLLQSFFLAAKGVWAVRLLSRSVHPPVPVVRVDRGAHFDGRFMEDAAAGRAVTGPLEPVSVKMMVAPGFHVYVAGAGMVKCKVVCLYNSRNLGYKDGGSSIGSVVKGSCSDINGGRDVVEECRRVMAK